MLRPSATSFTTPRAGSGSVDTLTGLLRSQADRLGDRLAFRFLNDASPASELSFAALETRARAIGCWLSKRSQPGDRVLLVYPAGLDFIAAFFGCLYAGVVATPTTYPKPRRPLPRTSRIAEDSGAKIALTTSQTVETIDFAQQCESARRLTWASTETLPEADRGWEPVDARPEDLAFLQYTSGSTSEPKGVMVTHANLVANLEAIRVAFGLPREVAHEEGQQGVFWLPAYHDMGLIGGVLTPLYVGGPSTLMAPTSFLQRPLRWLRAIHDFRAAISGAPNFGYELCLRRTTPEDRAGLDLSSWNLAFCGAEPISAATLREFADAFEPSGFSPNAFYPCYGLAEATLLAAGPAQHGAPPHVLELDRAALRDDRVQHAAEGRPTHELVGCGTAPLGAGIDIVDPQSGLPLSDRQVGEVWVSGPSVAGGYWNRGEESRHTFGATLPGRPERFLRTGDLGFVSGGELFITGRLKDVIILRGRNYYPQDIEEVAQAAHDALLPGAAFSLEPDASDPHGAERLIVAMQLDRSSRQGDHQAVVEAVRRAVAREHEIDPWAVVLLRQGALPVTSSGKVQRSLCRERWLAGELKVVHEWRRSAARTPAGAAAAPDAPPIDGQDPDVAVEALTRWVGEWLAAQEVLPLAEYRPETPFAEMGVDSLTAVELAQQIEEQTGVDLPPVIAWNYPTPAALSRYLVEQRLGGSPGSEGAPVSAGGADAEEADLESLLRDIEGLSDDEARRLLG